MLEESDTPAIGIMCQMWAAHHVADRDAIRTAIEEICLADELGFNSIWIGEHHHVRTRAAFYGRVPASEIFLAHIAALTSRIVVGTGVRILSTTPAMRTAEEMSLLDLLTDGRAEFGVGLGSGQVKMKSREEKAAEFRRLLEELLTIIEGNVEDEPALSPTPSPRLTQKIWAAARDEPTLEYLAGRGINLVVGQAELPEVQAKYVRHYKEAGGVGGTRGVRLVFVAETHDEAMAQSHAATEIYFGMMAKQGYHREAIEAGMLPTEIKSEEDKRRQVNFIVGTPDEVAEALNRYVGTTGVDRLDVMAQIPGLESGDVRRSFRLLQEEVRPQLRLGPWQNGRGRPSPQPLFRQHTQPNA